jgi:hypothetical protein
VNEQGEVPERHADEACGDLDDAALYAIGVIAMLASANALAHSYAGLYEWAVHHRLTGWQARSWPAEIDVFLAVGELALGALGEIFDAGRDVRRAARAVKAVDVKINIH